MKVMPVMTLCSWQTCRFSTYRLGYTWRRIYLPPAHCMPALRYASSITRCICAASRKEGMQSRPSATADKNA